MGKEQELRPCPLCGAELTWDGPLATFVHPFDDCHLSGHFVKVDEIAAWNRRSSNEQAEVVGPVGILVVDDDGILRLSFYEDGPPTSEGDELYAAPPAVAAGGVTEEMVEALARKIDPMIFGPNYTGRTKDVARAAINAALADEGIREGWQRVDANTPRDGTMIQLYNVAHDEQAIMGWTDDVGMPAIFPDGCWTDAGGQNRAINRTFNGGYFQFWRPLPTPPSRGEGV